MYFAIDENGNRIDANFAEKGKEYFCPVCNGRVELKSGEIRVNHFAHLGNQCEDSWEYDMSEWHKKMQNMFPENCQEVVVEHNGEKHRADVMVGDIVIEFQHSPISAKEIAERNSFYLSRGYKMVWVFDADNRIKNEYGDSIDPLICRNGHLCWKREKAQFANGMPKDVTVYLHYKTPVSIPQLNGQKIDVLILLTDVEPKDISFVDTEAYGKYYYLTIDNFLKEYGASTNENIPSIKDIVNYANKYKRELKSRNEELERRRLNQAFNSYMSRRRGGGHRRF